MEVVCDLDMYILHYFCLRGMLNDLNIMWMSPLMNSIRVGQFPIEEVKYEIDGEELHWLFFLTDGIYPENYKIYIQTLPRADGPNEKLFCSLQEGARKCVENLLGLLFKRFRFFAEWRESRSEKHREGEQDVEWAYSRCAEISRI